MHLVAYLQSALVARTLFARGRDYIVNNGRVQIVDEYTGRIMDDRRYSDGLHQALEAREGVPIEAEQSVVASITYPNLFRRYPKLAGMSGTAYGEKEEFTDLYGLEVVQIPTNSPLAREDLADRLYRTAFEKFAAVAAKVEELSRQGQPVLVGTRSVAANDYLHKLLQERKIPHQVLSARSVKDNTAAENAVLARAGRCGMVTIATNMAGRGVDIKPDLVNFKAMTREVYKAVRAKEPVLIRVRRQEERDELLKWLQRNGIHPVEVPAGLKAEGKPGEALIMVLEKDEQQAEAAGFNGRVLDSRDYPTGGLYVIGTERHESRRIDRQLVGRSGRQGNPGISEFYLSLDDEILKLHADKKAADQLMEGALKEGHPVSAPAVEKLVEDAQKRIENLHFDSRRYTTKFDQVVNRQREAVYQRRREVLEGYDMEAETLGMIEEWVSRVVDDAAGNRKKISQGAMDAIAGRCRELCGDFPSGIPSPGVRAGEMKEILSSRIRDRYYEALRTPGREKMKDQQRNSMLQAIDKSWFEHLAVMDELQSGVGLVAYAEQDPWVEYQNRGYEAFVAMEHAVAERYLESLLKPREEAPSITYITVNSMDLHRERT